MTDGNRIRAQLQAAAGRVSGELLTPPEAAAALGLHTATVAKLIASGSIPSTLLGRRRYIGRAAVERILREANGETR